MAINPVCDICKKSLKEFGAILLSPPDHNSHVVKMHICTTCYRKIVKQHGIELALKQIAAR